jgi:hypothetical protein
MAPSAAPYNGRQQAVDTYSAGKILLTGIDTDEMEKGSVAISVERVKKLRDAG